ncbi:MAG TPA: hypothetical protein VNQ90_05685 [Chthoniobacteraceae bacterium]|nr:hypothetical protein [Chthoniobacteraceae bacterium]
MSRFFFVLLALFIPGCSWNQIEPLPTIRVNEPGGDAVIRGTLLESVASLRHEVQRFNSRLKPIAVLEKNSKIFVLVQNRDAKPSEDPYELLEARPSGIDTFEIVQP